MSTDLATRTLAIRDMNDLARVGQMLADSGYFADAKEAAQCGVKVLAGLEMGFGAFASMSGIHIIQGRPAIGANLMAARVKSSGKYDFRVRQLDDDMCDLEFFQGAESIGRSKFSREDAKRAGTQNMGKFPRNMLYARAMSNGVKWYTPDVFLGAPVYTAEELGAETDEDGNIVDVSSRVERVVRRPALEAPAPEAAPAPAAAPAPVQAADGMVTDDQKVALGAAFKVQGVPPKNRIGFLRYAVRPDVATIHHLTEAEADRVLGWTGDEWGEHLAAYAVALEGGPPDVSDLEMPDRPVEFDPNGNANRTRKGAAS